MSPRRQIGVVVMAQLLGLATGRVPSFFFFTVIVVVVVVVVNEGVSV